MGWFDEQIRQRKQNDQDVFEEIDRRGKPVVLCGGTGLYVESVIKGYRMSFVPESKELRTSLQHKTLDELTGILKSYKTLHNKTDVDTAQRAIAAASSWKRTGTRTPTAP